MFNIGLPEIILVIIVLFVVAPFDIPKVIKKISEYFALLGKLKNDLKDMGNDLSIKEIKEEVHTLQNDLDIQGRVRENKNAHPQMDNKPSLESKYHEDSLREVKLLALDLLRKDYDFSQTPRVVVLLCDNHPEVREKAFEVLLLDPLFLFEKRNIPNHVPSDSDRNPAHAIEELFSDRRIEEISKIISDFPEKYFKPVVHYLAQFPGIENLDLNMIFSGEKRKYYEQYCQLVNEYISRKYPPQLTISPSYDCNLNCRYCFTYDLKKIFQKDMNIPSFIEILDRVNKDHRLKRVSLFGGEPTLLKNINEYIDEIEQRSLTFYFATNGLAPPHLFEEITARSSLEMITFHIEKDGFYTEKQLDTLVHNIQKVDKKRIKVILRYNMEDPHYKEWDFLHKYIDLLPEFRFNFAIVFPSKIGKNEFIPLDEIGQFREKILSMVSFVVNFVVNNVRGKRFKLVFAKPFPLCFFNENELKTLLKFTEVKNVCEIDRNCNTNNICVNPDGSFFPCMALNSKEYLFPQINQLDRLESTYYAAVERIIRKPMLEQCRKCSLHFKGVCQAVCYAYV